MQKQSAHCIETHNRGGGWFAGWLGHRTKSYDVRSADWQTLVLLMAEPAGPPRA